MTHRLPAALALALLAAAPAAAIEAWKPASPRDIAALAFCHAREAARLDRVEKSLRWSADWTPAHQRYWTQREAHRVVGAVLGEYADADAQAALVEVYGPEAVTRGPAPDGRNAEAWLHMNCAEMTNRMQIALQKAGRLDRVALTPVDPSGATWNAPGEPRLRMGEEP